MKTKLTTVRREVAVSWMEGTVALAESFLECIFLNVHIQLLTTRNVHGSLNPSFRRWYTKKNMIAATMSDEIRENALMEWNGTGG